ncbi:MAG: hypothetical protein ACM3XZ_05245 [Betaproteobacteria bacterium]
MQDKLVPGLLAGATAGAVIDLGNAIAYHALKVTTLRNLDWAAILVFRHPPRSPAETVFAEVVHLVFTALLGVVFAYASHPLAPTRHRIVRGMTYGAAVWMFTYAATLLFKVPYVTIVPWPTAVTGYVLALIFGSVLACVLARLLDERMVP